MPGSSAWVTRQAGVKTPGPLTHPQGAPGPPPVAYGLRAHSPDPAGPLDSPTRRPLACFLTARIHPVGRGEASQCGDTAACPCEDLPYPPGGEQREGGRGESAGPALPLLPLQDRQGQGQVAAPGATTPRRLGPSLRAEGNPGARHQRCPAVSSNTLPSQLGEPPHQLTPPLSEPKGGHLCKHRCKTWLSGQPGLAPSWTLSWTPPPWTLCTNPQGQQGCGSMPGSHHARTHSHPPRPLG